MKQTGLVCNKWVRLKLGFGAYFFYGCLELSLHIYGVGIVVLEVAVELPGVIAGLVF
jgi:hypothetical protein